MLYPDLSWLAEQHIRAIPQDVPEQYVLMYSTDFPDRKEAEIYEGDVCLYPYTDHENPWPWIVLWCSGKQEYSRARPGWVLADYKHTINFVAESTLEHPQEFLDGVVIGNIYEQPELNMRNEHVFWRYVRNAKEQRQTWKAITLATQELNPSDLP